MTQSISGQRQRDGQGPESSRAEPSAAVQDLARERARVAWRWVADVEKKPYANRYGTLARKLPSYLQVSGLGQTLAFLLSKSKQDNSKPMPAERVLLQQIEAYLRSQSDKNKTKDLMDLVLEMAPTEYRRATRDMMLVAEWLKRFAEGKLEKQEE